MGKSRTGEMSTVVPAEILRVANTPLPFGVSSLIYRQQSQRKVRELEFRGMTG